MVTVLAALTLLAGASTQDLTEPETQAAFVKEFKDKSATKREVAVRRMVGLKEEKSLQLLAGALKDPDAAVRKTTADVIATCTDFSGAALKPLAAVLTNKKEDKDVRLACARALAKAPYKTEPIDALITTITGIGEQDKDLFAFGAECTRLLNEVAGQDFGAGKETPDKWKNWWKENKPRLVKEDQEKLAAYKKSGSAKK